MAESPTINSRRSSTSTILYSQEPYETFSRKVMQLLQGLHPDCDGIVVERMAGGGYNRIVKATLMPSSTSISTQHIIIRIPRFNNNADMDSNIAVLRYLSHHPNSIPVPHILQYDLTEHNHIGTAYMIQKYVTGTSLQHLMPTLIPEELLELATELAEATARICTTTFEHVGILCAGTVSKGKSNANAGSSVGFAIPKTSNSAVHEPFSNTLDFLIESYEFHTRNAQVLDANDTWLPVYMEKLKEIARVINTKRPFSNKFCLLHNDFMARNVHVTERTNGRGGRGLGAGLGIAAIFDWDDTTSAPIEAAYVRPHWLWTWSPESEEGRNEMADAVPESADLRAAKIRFEEEIELRIPEFMSTWREGSAARELFYFAINGLVYQDDAKRIDQLAVLELPEVSDNI